MGYRSQNIGRASSPSCVVPRWCARTTVHLTRRTRCPSPARLGKEGGRRMAGLFGLVTPPDACARSRLQRAQSHLGHEPTLATSRGAVGCIVFPYAHSSLYRLDPAQAAHRYAILVGEILLADKEPWPTGRGLAMLHEAQQTILHYVRQHWIAVRAHHGFDHLPRWCLKAINQCRVGRGCHISFDPSNSYPTYGPSASDTSSLFAMTSAGLVTTRPPEKRGPVSFYAAVLSKHAAKSFR